MTSSLTLEAEFLGTLAKILSDLGGYDTLACELIQNADDARRRVARRPRPRFKFDVSDDAVTVWNDGEFSWCETWDRDCPLPARCDLHSFLRVAGETKRGRGETTGAFGVGFTAVYQVTDRPELITAGVHLVLRPELPHPQDRVSVCDGCPACADPTGTTFRLPWAAEDSLLRRQLGVEPRRDPDGFARDLRGCLLDALPFLRRVERIELTRDGVIVGLFRRERDSQTVSLIGPDGTIELHRLFAGFADQATLLRGQRGAPIEAKRRSDVEVLVGDIERGRIYAGLPTRQRVPARMLLAGDFFPHSSRKVISLEHDLRSDWNRAALRAGAEAVADSLEALPARIGALSTWELIASIRRTTAGEDDEAFAAYWPIVAAAARDAAILPTAAGNLVAPSDALFVAAEEDDPALGLLDELGGAVPIPELRRVLAPLPRSEDLGMRDLGPSTLAGLLDARNIDELSADGRRTLWELMDRMLRRARAGKGFEAAQAHLTATNTAPEVDGGMVTWDDLSAADAATVELFRPYASLLDDDAVAQLDDLRMMASPFRVADAIYVLEQAASRGLERPLELLRWFADRRREIRADVGCNCA